MRQRNHVEYRLSLYAQDFSDAESITFRRRQSAEVEIRSLPPAQQFLLERVTWLGDTDPNGEGEIIGEEILIERRNTE